MKPYGELSRRLLALNAGDYLTCQTERERIASLTSARLQRISVASVKLRDGGFLILRLKKRVLHRCPQCGYRQPHAHPQTP